MRTITSQQVIAEMLTENTGRHILDSGDAYGRHWQKNNGRTLSEWNSEPEAWADSWGVTLSVYHYLTNRLEYAPLLDEEFRSFCEANPDDSHLGLAESFATEKDSSAHSWNTYNGNDSLSQTLQGVTFSDGDEVFVLLQIHGGADVRGGYTTPRAFRVTVDMAEAFPYDNADYYLHCPNDEEHSVSVNYGEAVSLVHGCSLADDESPIFGEAGSESPLCPKCKIPFTVEAPQAY
jgi:hypothetical protein